MRVHTSLSLSLPLSLHLTDRLHSLTHTRTRAPTHALALFNSYVQLVTTTSLTRSCHSRDTDFVFD